MIYLIEKAWTDWLENNLSDAFGYEPVGFVSSEEEAKSIVSSGGLVPDMWALYEPTPLYRYRALEVFKPEVKP